MTKVVSPFGGRADDRNGRELRRWRPCRRTDEDGNWFDTVVERIAAKISNNVLSYWIICSIDINTVCMCHYARPLDCGNSELKVVWRTWWDAQIRLNSTQLNCFPLSDKISSGVEKSAKNPSRASILEAGVSVRSLATHGHLLYSSTKGR